MLLIKAAVQAIFQNALFENEPLRCIFKLFVENKVTHNKTVFLSSVLMNYFHKNKNTISLKYHHINNRE